MRKSESKKGQGKARSHQAYQNSLLERAEARVSALIDNTRNVRHCDHELFVDLANGPIATIVLPCCELKDGAIIEVQVPTRAYQMADHLIDVIRKTPGGKIVTLNSDAIPGQAACFDVDKDGIVGYDPSHLELFRTRIASGLTVGLSMTIRQFLPTRYQEANGNWFPYKKIYGVSASLEAINPLDADLMACCHRTNPQTGQLMEPEQGVIFGTLEIAMPAELADIPRHPLVVMANCVEE